MDTRFNLAADLIGRRLAAGDGARVAVECDDAQWTYEEIGRLVDEAGRALIAAGVGPGDRVAIVLPDSVEFIAAFLGAIKIGGVAVPCSTFLGAEDYRYFLTESSARAAVVGDSLRSVVDPVLAGMPHVRRVTIHERLGSPASPLVAAETGPDDAAFWLWTSGTTGQPKAAVHRHQDAACCCRAVADNVLELTAADRVFSAAKLFHAYGLGNGLFFPFWVGATAILLSERARAQTVYELLHRARPTVFFGVPTLFAAMLSLEDVAARVDLSSIRCCMSAAEPLPADLFTRWKARFGSEILDGIGSTEMLHTYITARRGRVKPGSVGSPLPGYEIKVLDEHGQPVGPHQSGDLFVRGPSLASMYWNRPEETARRMQDGWFATGDKFFVDEQGYYWYAGRSDDMFKVSGEWVSPAEVEALLIQHPSVLECAIVPYAEASGVLKPKACVVLRPGTESSDALAAELQAHVRERTHHYKAPRVVEFMRELPKTATGKIQRYKLRL